MFWKQVKIMTVQHCECVKCHRILHFNMINVMLSEFHPNKLFLKTYVAEGCYPGEEEGGLIETNSHRWLCCCYCYL